MAKIVSLVHPMNIIDFGWKTKKLWIFLKFLFKLTRHTNRVFVTKKRTKILPVFNILKIAVLNCFTEIKLESI